MKPVNASKSQSLAVAALASDDFESDLFTDPFETSDIADDCLDIADKRFDDDFYSFRTDVKQVERRLASVLNQGYEDCATVVAAFKLIDAFEGLLERDSLQPDLLKKQSELVAAYAIDLRQVNKLFLSQRSKSAEGFYLEREGPPLYMNMPPVAGALFWVRGLLDRVSMPMNKLRGGMSRVLDAEESRDVVKLHDSLVRLLKEYEEAAYKEWEGGVEATSAAKLKQPILVRNEETSLLSVNFDPDLLWSWFICAVFVVAL